MHRPAVFVSVLTLLVGVAANSSSPVATDSSVAAWIQATAAAGQTLSPSYYVALDPA